MKLLLCAMFVAAAGVTGYAQHSRLFPPTELGALEGPDREDWQQPERIMDALRIAEGSVVADLGAGGGWFTVRLARRVGPNGRVYAEDVQPQMIEAITRRVQREGLRNVVPRLGTHDDPKLPAGGVDVVLMVDTYNEVEARVALLKNIARALTSDGRIGIVNFKKDGGGPGPDMDDRVGAEEVIRDAEAAGLRLQSRETFLRYQYFLIFERARA
ncbi:MAG TPA: class I SAM-dependent methyltransferase [Vicinamibacterales bacterium]|jgi:ubiquinone/menaquinone biosynthesis C-methylase UbiE|nr:class I SAM-dependent methyltransferase [Vicinamibacterales bacterium]